MKNNKNKKRLFSGIAVLAVSASAVLGTLSFTGGFGSSSYKPGQSDLEKGIIATALGNSVQRAAENSKIYYVSPEVEYNPEVTHEYTKEDPGNLETLLHTDSTATAKLKPGDTVYLMATEGNNVYEPATRMISVVGASPYMSAKIVLAANGSYDSYIVITADPEATAKPVIDFKNQTFDSRNRGIEMNGSYIYFEGIDVMAAGDNGIYVSGSYNTIENCEFAFNRDTGLQIGRSGSNQENINTWPAYNLVKNCTSHNNYDNETYGENADGFAAKLTIGYGNVFDGCIAYRNSDDGWDLFAKQDSGCIGSVAIYNCVAFENGFIESTINDFNAHFPESSITDKSKLETANGNGYTTMNGDGNGFKLGGESMRMDVTMYNCLSFNNRLHGFTDNSNPGVLSLSNITGVDNGRGAGSDIADQNTFGEIIDVAYTDDASKYSANIDLARWDYSYNVLANALSVHGQLATNVEDDAYRGSVSNSLLVTNGAKQYIVKGSLDADTGSKNFGTETTKLTSDIFEKVAIEKHVSEENVITYTYNLSGKASYLSDTSIDRLLRNEDRSVNMGEFFKVKEGQAQVGGKTVGADLSKASDTYVHPVMELLSDYEQDTENKSRLERAKELLELPLDEEYVYQDFRVPAALGFINIEWTTNNDALLEIGEATNPEDKELNPSHTSFRTIVVNRQSDGDKEVTLTAKLKLGTASVEKEFHLILKKMEYKLGELVVTGNDGNRILDGARLILDQYAVYLNPVITVSNGFDYNGKLLPASEYKLTTKYEFQTDANAPKIEVAGFAPSHAGVFTVTHTATLNSDNSQVSMSYVIYAASPAANVDFSGSARITLNPKGYNIAGDMSSATGTLYAVSSASELTDLTAANIKSYNGVVSKSFRDTSISMSFDNANGTAYHIYYALANVNGEVTSQVYHTAISLVDITTPADFRTVAGGGKIGSEDPALTIYKLANDIDFANEATIAGGSDGANYNYWADGDKTLSFAGLLNGNGKTVKNVVVNGNSTKDVSVGLFANMKDGTIMNVKFENITMNSTTQSTGIVCRSRGGYYYNIAMKNIRVNGKQRVAALIGLVGETQNTSIYIENVSLDNSEIDLENKQDYIGESAGGKNSNAAITGERAGGLIGFVQCGNDAIGAQIYIINSYVHADIKGSTAIAGFVGCYEDEATGTGECGYVLDIRYSVYHGTLVCASSSHRAGGFIGYHKGGKSSPLLYRCASLIDVFYDNNNDVTKEPQKNASALIGQQASIGVRVENCLVVNNNVYDDTHQAEYITGFEKLASEYVEYFTKNLGLDSTIWTVHTNEDGTELVAPYISLNFKA